MTTTITGATGIDNIQAATGSVLQVVASSTTTTFSTTSNTPVDVTGLSATITPSSTSSKILVTVNFRYGSNASSIIKSLLLRGATEIDIGGSSNLSNVFNGTGSTTQGFGVSSFSYLDSPSSTSALTYKIQVLTADTGTLSINNRNDGNASNNHIGSITLMEIAG